MNFILAFTGIHAADDSDPNSLNPVKVITGGAHTCLLTENGRVKCWGYNNAGQLGIGNTKQQGSEPGTMGEYLPFVDLGTNQRAIDICAGRYHTCALTAQNQIKCWGNNTYGQLGQGRPAIAVGTTPDDMGDHLPYVNLGDQFVTKRLMCGGDFTCALSDKGTAKCWGNGGQGQLGIRMYSSSDLENSIGRRPEQMGNNLAPLPITTPIQQMGLGNKHGCALTNGKIVCWGTNDKGQIGVQTTTRVIYLPTPQTSDPFRETLLEEPTDVVAVQSLYVGDESNCVQYTLETFKDTNSPIAKLKCWGRNFSGELGLGSPASIIGNSRSSMGRNLGSVNIGITDIEEIAMHSGFVCAKSKAGQVKCWGENATGALGLGDQVTRGKSPADMGANLPFVNLGLRATSISTGAATFSCAILINHGVKCWGYAGSGGLGYQDDLSRGLSSEDMGDQLPYVVYK